MKRFWMACSLLVVATLAQTSSPARPAEENAQGFALFSSKVDVPAGGAAAAMQVDVKDWSVTKAGLEVPDRGFYVAQLLLGVVVTEIEGKSQTRNPGEFWTVKAGEAMKVTLAPRKEAAQLWTVAITPGRY
jgi:hypothetical protein